MKRNNVVTKIGMKTLLSLTGSACWVFSLLLMLTACQSDETSGPGVGLQPDGKVRFHLKVGVAGSETTRAWADGTNAGQEEMMNVWTVVVVNDNDGTDKNKIVAVYACKPSGDPDQEIDQIDKIGNDYVELPEGKYRFYSFANMSPTVAKALCIDAAVIGGESRTRGDNEPAAGNDPTTGGGNEAGSDASVGKSYQSSGDAVRDQVSPYTSPDGTDNFFSDDINYKKNTIIPIDFTSGTTVTESMINAMTVNVAGNNFDVTTNNGYGVKGIPMSNVQTITVTEETTTIELIVVRMMAKIEVDVYNNGETDATIHSISLTDITKNTNANLKLLPKFLSTSGPNTMEVEEVSNNQTISYHKDIQPNLRTDVPTGNMTLYPNTAQGFVSKDAHKLNIANGTGNPVKFVFYVNESMAPDNGSGHFYLSLGIKTGVGTDVVYSHALINPKGKTSADDNAWNYIARNDYRIIPVVLTDWLFRIEPIALAPIGGYPTPTLSSNGLKATFDTGGMIALQPYVKNRKEDFWRDFSDPEVTFTEIHWTNSDGNDVSGPGKIVKTAFTYDPLTKYIIGELNQDRVTTDKSNRTAITVTVKLGPTGSQFTYNFTCDVAI